MKRIFTGIPYTGIDYIQYQYLQYITFSWIVAVTKTFINLSSKYLAIRGTDLSHHTKLQAGLQIMQEILNMRFAFIFYFFK